MKQELKYEPPEDKQEVLVNPRLFVNSFPKSGTHLAEQMVQGFVMPMNFFVDGELKPWAGSFRDHSWTTHWMPDRIIYRRLGYIVDGAYAKGHMGYKDTIERFLWGSRVATLFVYRDLRDVAVSLTHHILNGQTHSHPEWYQEMGFNGALIAVIVGLGPYAGVIERWNEYAGWLDIDWVLKLKFEDLIGPERRGWCESILRYAGDFAGETKGYKIDWDAPASNLEEIVDRMVENSKRTDKSPTFRKGEAGGWRDEFSEAAVELFKMQDAKWAEEAGLESASWLVELGYEDDTDWGLD